ncbi:MAG: hypothetical protein HY367_02850 [Candidatus Aenigmarchaeota archaeon]|nr:hypothetical protein [Candidatus Aenigmarchaeota archaeon]
MMNQYDLVKLRIMEDEIEGELDRLVYNNSLEEADAEGIRKILYGFIGLLDGNGIYNWK